MPSRIDISIDELPEASSLLDGHDYSSQIIQRIAGIPVILDVSGCLGSHWGRSCLASRLRTSPMARLGISLFEFIQSILLVIKLLTAQSNYQCSSAIKINALKIVREVAAQFSMRRSSSNVASPWLDISQFWGNLAKSLTDADLDVDE